MNQHMRNIDLLVHKLRADPNALRNVTASQFELLIAEILTRFGWEVDVVDGADNGHDMLAVSNVGPGLQVKWLVECKYVQPLKPVGVDAVRSLYGARISVDASNALLATTGKFTQGARDFAEAKSDLRLVDYDQVVAWLNEFTWDLAADADELKRRLHNAQESFDTEIKSWVDPGTDAGDFVIGGACMALRNNNGGFLIIGIRNSGKADERNPFPDIRATFHIDKIQAIIRRYASDPFEVTVDFVERDGQERVMIGVPSGVRVPVICKSDLPRLRTADGHEAGTLLRKDTIYVRTLNASGVISTAPVQAKDLPRLMDLCFENREADIGAFFRRQLSSIDVGSASKALIEILRLAVPQEQLPSPEERLNGYLHQCHKKFVDARNAQTDRPPASIGTREVAALILGDFEKPALSQEFMLGLNVQVPSFSGWRPWASVMDAANSRSNARAIREGWEGYEYDKSWHVLDYGRIEDEGRFYYLEGFQDDLTDTIRPNTQIDFVLQTARVAEIVATVLVYAKAFCGTDSENSVAFAFRWRELKNRHLSSWADQSRRFTARQPAIENEIVTYATMPVATVADAIGPHVEKLVAPLFRLFGGWAFQSSVLQQVVTERLSSRL